MESKNNIDFFQISTKVPFTPKEFGAGGTGDFI
jgi:hypothetical protein